MRPPYNSFPNRPYQRQGNGNHNASSRQVQSQMNMAPPPFNGSMAPMNMAPGFMNALPMQNNHLGMQQMGLLGNMPGFNAGPGQFPNNMAQIPNQMNMFQGPGQFPLNGNMGFPNMQIDLPNAIQALNQLLALQLVNASQVPQFNGFPGPNQGMAPQNQHLGLLQQMNQSQQPHVATANSHSSQPNMSQNSPMGNKTLESSTNNGATSTPNMSHQNFQRKDFGRNQNGEGSRMGFQKSHNNHIKNGKGKFDNRDRHRGKGIGDGQIGKGGISNAVNQANKPKRCYWLTYTDKEVQQWRDARKKNHPFNPNPKKKIMDPKAKETITVERREQLKQILAKQAELGVEVAEIPKHYLIDNSASNLQGTEGDKPFTKEKFQNKFGKRKRRNHQKDRLNKKQRLDETTSNSTSTDQKSQPSSLLKKLLAKDIQRDKVRLLQVFRFMVTNSFFKDWPEHSLKFPVVTVDEEVYGAPETPAENIDDKSVDDEDDDSTPADDGLLVEEEEKEEEEGEITD